MWSQSEIWVETNTTTEFANDNKEEQQIFWRKTFQQLLCQMISSFLSCSMSRWSRMESCQRRMDRIALVSKYRRTVANSKINIPMSRASDGCFSDRVPKPNFVHIQWRILWTERSNPERNFISDDGRSLRTPQDSHRTKLYGATNVLVAPFQLGCRSLIPIYLDSRYIILCK
jgi:hypothetical protein